MELREALKELQDSVSDEEFYRALEKCLNKLAEEQNESKI